MSMSDPIADLLTRIRNGVQADHATVDIPASRLKVEVCRVLKEEGFIQDYAVEAEKTPAVDPSTARAAPGEPAEPARVCRLWRYQTGAQRPRDLDPEHAAGRHVGQARTAAAGRRRSIVRSVVMRTPAGRASAAASNGGMGRVVCERMRPCHE